MSKLGFTKEFTIIKEQLTDSEVERCILAHKAGISPKLIKYDYETTALTFERCEPISDLAPYYHDIYDLLLKGIRYDRQLAHCDPGPKCSSEKGCNVMLLNDKPVFIDWGEVCPDDNSNVGAEILALDIFMKYWFKPATNYKFKDEAKILTHSREMKQYINNKYTVDIDKTTPYEKLLREKIEMKQQNQKEQDERLAAKLNRYSKSKNKGGATKHKGTKHKGTKHKGTKHKGTKHKGTKRNNYRRTLKRDKYKR